MANVINTFHDHVISEHVHIIVHNFVGPLCVDGPVLFNMKLESIISHSLNRFRFAPYAYACDRLTLSMQNVMLHWFYHLTSASQIQQGIHLQPVPMNQSKHNEWSISLLYLLL